MALRVKHLPAEVGFINRVKVANSELADATRRQVGGSGTADATYTDQENLAFGNPPLPVRTNLRQCEVTCVAAQGHSSIVTSMISTFSTGTSW